MNALLLEAVIVVVGNLTTDFFFVLVLNPRRASKKIKDEIASDKTFRETFIKNLLQQDMLSLYDPILDKLKEKLRGSLIQNMGQEAILDKSINKAIVEDMKESDPNMDLLLEGLKVTSPNLYKLAIKRPDLLPKIIEKARGLGLPIGNLDISGENPYE